jgi:hypothetical protein
MPARVLKAPAEFNAVHPGRILFLAGAVSNGDWQDPMVRRLAPHLDGWTIVNPRLDDPPKDDAGIREEIAWEYRHLHDADAVLFWLEPPTFCPISLYELGKVTMTEKPLFLGVHPAYDCRTDVVVQTQLARPDAVIVHSLDELAEAVLEHLAPARR